MYEVKTVQKPENPPQGFCAFCGVPDLHRRVVFVGKEGKKICDVCLEDCVRLIQRADAE